MTSDDAPAGAPTPALPAIPVSAGALIFDRPGRLLILKPTYKSGWTIPGGVMEADGETPWEACQREVREECGLTVSHGQLVCMDFRRPHPGKPGGIRFLFHCGILDDDALAAIVLQPEEISGYQLTALPEALSLLRRPIRLRVEAAASGRGLVYLEDGQPVPSVSGELRHSGMSIPNRGARQERPHHRRVVMPDEEAQVRDLLADMVAGYRAKDAARIVAGYAPGIVLYSLAPPLRSHRGDLLDIGGGRHVDMTTAEGVQKWLDGFGDAPFDFELDELEVAAGGDAGYANGLARMGSAGAFSMWLRVTFGLRKAGGRWQITHLHESVPFRMDQTFKAAVDLEP